MLKLIFRELGYENHYFIPISQSGPIFCIWESSKDISKDEFQEFVDGKNGPAPGMFVNECHKTSGGNYPSAYFAWN